METPPPAKFAGVPATFQLTVKGLRYLEENHGLNVAPRVKSAEHKIVSWTHMSHLLAVNDFLINLELIGREQQHLTINHITHDLDMHPGMYGVESGNGKPDVLVELEIDGTPEVWWVEVDRGDLFEDPTRWRQKVGFIIDWTQGPFRELYPKGTYLSVIGIAAPDKHQDRRAEALIHWTELELLKRDKSDWGNMFCITGVVPGELSPHELFGEPRWYHPEPSKRATLREFVRLPFADRRAVPLLKLVE